MLAARRVLCLRRGTGAPWLGRQCATSSSSLDDAAAQTIALLRQHPGLLKEVQRRNRRLRELQAMAETMGGGAGRVQQEIAGQTTAIEQCKQMQLCYESAVNSEHLMGLTMSFYTLVGEVIRPLAGGGQVNAAQMNLEAFSGEPDSVKFFAALPEYVLEDMVEFLLYTSNLASQGNSPSVSSLSTISHYFAHMTGGRQRCGRCSGRGSSLRQKKRAEYSLPARQYMEKFAARCTTSACDESCVRHGWLLTARWIHISALNLLPSQCFGTYLGSRWLLVALATSHV